MCVLVGCYGGKGISVSGVGGLCQVSKGRKSLLVRGGRNKAGRFLEVVAFVDDDRKGIIWIPEARSGQGWRRFVVELRSLVAALASSLGSSSEGSLPKEKSRGTFQGIEAGQSFAEALQSPSCEVEDLVGPQLMSS
jgi:hypothetical protein